MAIWDTHLICCNTLTMPFGNLHSGFNLLHTTITQANLSDETLLTCLACTLNPELEQRVDGGMDVEDIHWSSQSLLAP